MYEDGGAMDDTGNTGAGVILDDDDGVTVCVLAHRDSVEPPAVTGLEAGGRVVMVVTVLVVGLFSGAVFGVTCVGLDTGTTSPVKADPDEGTRG